MKCVAYFKDFCHLLDWDLREKEKKNNKKVDGTKK